MKKLFIFIFILGHWCLQETFSQTIRPWPIPSFNIPVFGRALFQENIHPDNDNTEGKRRIHIQVSSQNGPETYPNSALVWIYSLDQTTVMGPYSVTFGVTLSEDIDERQWGVLVQCEVEVVVDVWIDNGDNSAINKTPPFIMNVNTLPIIYQTAKQEGGNR